MSKMYFHASQAPNIQVLEPRISNHGIARVYLSAKRENVLVYLSNPVEKYCRETGFLQNGPWTKWASYGFQGDKLCLDEYYPNALEDSFQGVSGYIYMAKEVPGGEAQQDIPGAMVTEQRVPVSGCEFVPDALRAILSAEKSGQILIRRYEDLPEKMLRWIADTIKKQYIEAEATPAYRHFLRGKFPEITAGLKENA